MPRPRMGALSICAVGVLLFGAGLSAQSLPTSGGMLGPNAPIIVDIDGDGQPSGGDAPILPAVQSDRSVVIQHPWSNAQCMNSATVLLTDPQPVTGKMTNANLGGLGNIDIGQTNSENEPVQFLFNSSTSAGVGTLQDGNGDGVYDGFGGQTTQGDKPSFQLSWDFADPTGDNKPDYVSIPWSMASAVGVDTEDDCDVGAGDGVDPQIFIPLADSNGDGVKDSIILDLNGDGTPDPEFFQSPALVDPAIGDPITVPTASEWGLILLSIGLVVVAWVQLRRRNYQQPV